MRICSFNLICQFGTWVSDPDAVIPYSLGRDSAGSMWVVDNSFTAWVWGGVPSPLPLLKLVRFSSFRSTNIPEGRRTMHTRTTSQSLRVRFMGASNSFVPLSSQCTFLWGSPRIYLFAPHESSSTTDHSHTYMHAHAHKLATRIRVRPIHNHTSPQQVLWPTHEYVTC